MRGYHVQCFKVASLAKMCCSHCSITWSALSWCINVHCSFTVIDYFLTPFYLTLQTVYLIPPGVSEYAGERCLLNCYPVLHSHGISDLTKAPCLSALLKNLHHILLDQYIYEEVRVF